MRDSTTIQSSFSVLMFVFYLIWWYLHVIFFRMVEIQKLEHQICRWKAKNHRFGKVAQKPLRLCTDPNLLPIREKDESKFFFLWILYKKKDDFSLFHVVDWHATILGMAGMPLEKFGDGLNQWKMLSTGISSEFRRSKFIYNINPPMSALRHDDFKFVYESLDFLIKGRGKSKLFNLRDDPLEQRDISRKHPFLVSMLIDRLFSYQKFSRKSVRTPLDLRGNPEKFKGIFATGWCQWSHFSM